MKRTFLVSFTGVVAVLATPGVATSWSPVPRHQRNYAICEAGRLADYVNAEWAEMNGKARLPDKYRGYLNIFLYTDHLGKVGQLNALDYTGEPASPIDFVKSLRSSNGKEDIGPIVASRLALLQSHKRIPVYLLNLRRTKWEVYQTLPDFHEVEKYETSESTWMMQFEGNELHLMRQADELGPTAREDPICWARGSIALHCGPRRLSKDQMSAFHP